MNKIDFKAGSKIVSFRKKSLFIDDDEFLYSEITNIRHSASKHVFAFECNGQFYHFEDYDLKYEKPIIELFARINSLNKAARTGAEAVDSAKPADTAISAEADASAEDVAPAADAGTPQTSDVQDEDEDSVFFVPSDDTEEEVSAKTDMGTMAEDAAPEAESFMSETPETDDTVADAETTENVSSDDTSAETVPEEIADSQSAEASTEKKEKKKKLKKSFIIFAAIIVVVGLLTAGYFLVFGTSDNPNAGPNATNGQNYDDIDQLIDDLDN